MVELIPQIVLNDKFRPKGLSIGDGHLVITGEDFEFEKKIS